MKTRIHLFWAAVLVVSLVSMAEAQTPTILVQPSNEVVLHGSKASFSVTVSGSGPFTYQWQCNGTNLHEGIISTVAGNGTAGYSGDGGAATNAELSYPAGVAVDASGNLFISDSGNNRIREVGTNGIITTVAGSGKQGYSGDGGAATNAEFWGTEGMVVDVSGNLFIADYDNSRIREVETNGIIKTVAGNGTIGYSGDGGAATNSGLFGPTGVAVDASGNLFIAENYYGRIRKVGTNGIITTVAGGFADSQSVTVDSFGNLFVAYTGNNRIREIGINGVITTVAGNGTAGYSGDGGAATSAELYYPFGVAVDASGNLFISDSGNNRIREVGTNGIITTMAGNGTQGYSGDGGAATNAELYRPQSAVVDSFGNLFVADTINNRIREVSFPGLTIILPDVEGANAGAYDVVVSSPYGSVTSSIVTLEVLLPPTIGLAPQSQGVGLGNNAKLSVVATGTAPLDYQWYFDGGTLAGRTNTTLLLSAAALTNAGSYNVVVTNLYGSVTSAVAVVTVGIPPVIAEQPANQTNLAGGTASFAVTVSGTGPFSYQWQCNGTNLPNGIITTVAGGFNDPQSVAVDSIGNLFVADSGNNRICEIGTNGITTITVANLNFPTGVAVDSSGNLFIADAHNNVIREVETNGIITTVAGNGKAGYSGDGGAATNAGLNYPYGMAMDVSGNLFIADWGNNRIREMGTNGIITTVAGNGMAGYSGDDVTATMAELSHPCGVGVDGAGNLFIADSVNTRIREVGTNGMITTVAGGGTGGLGDGGVAINAELSYPSDVAVDASGNLFIADYSSSRIREMRTNGIITTMVGNGTAGYSGDSGAATNAELNWPKGVAVDASGNLFIADQNNGRIRKVFFQGPALVLNNLSGANAGAYDVVVSSPYGSVTSSIVTLEVMLPPTIGTAPLSQGVVLGNNAKLSVVATGTAPLDYQWYFDGGALAGQTNTTLLLSAAAYTNAGSYNVVVTNLYGSVTSAVAIVTVEIPPMMQYVNVSNAYPAPPYTNWDTAATNIQDAVNAAGADGTIFVTNGTYYPVTVNKPLTLQGVNGPGVTLINGGGSNRCVYLTDGVVLVGFTLTNGSAYQGGGVYCESTSAELDNCVLTGNSANNGGGGGGAYGGTLNNCTFIGNLATGYYGWWSEGNYPGVGGGAYNCNLNNCTLIGNSADEGGGAYCDPWQVCTLNNCTLTGNSANYEWVYGGEGGGAYGGTLNNCLLTVNSAPDGYGGGAADCTLNNCTLTGNSAYYGGGAYSDGYPACVLYNCIVYFNAATNGPNCYLVFLNNCCTTPIPSDSSDGDGGGNITNDPAFVNASAGNYHLSSGSPCINAGDNDYYDNYVGDTDLDGLPRLVGGTVDMGAYEFNLAAYQPAITLQPQSLKVNLGFTVSFTVKATDLAPLNYQWLFNGTNVIATNATLVLTSVQKVEQGFYSVVVGNPYGTATSSNALLDVNQPPVADASATKPVVISPNGTNAMVVLNGTRASDSDGDLLQYAWYESANASPLANGAVAVVVLPVGTNSLFLVVNDGMAWATNSFSVEVITTAQAVERLIVQVNSTWNHSQPLLATLSAALASSERGNPVSAINQLQAFQNQVRAQVSPQDAALAQAFIQKAQEIIDALTNGNANSGGRSHGAFTKVQPLPNGHIHMQFSADVGCIYVLEASTNLVDWEMIGLAKDQGDGTFTYEDTNAAKFPCRYYRIKQLEH